MSVHVQPSDVQRSHEADECFLGLEGSAVRTRLAGSNRLNDAGHRRLSFYLHDMEVRRVYQETGHASTVHYAEERLDLDRRRTGELLSVRKRLFALPAIDCALAKGEVSWSKVLLLVTVASAEHEDEWLALAQRLSVRRLAHEVRLAKPGSAPRKAGDRKGLSEIRFKEEASLDVLEHQKVELAKKKLAAEQGRPVGTRELLVMLSDLALRLEPDGSVPGTKRVDSSLYRIVLHAQEPSGTENDATVLVDTDDGLVPLEHAEAHRCDAESCRVDDATPDPGGGKPDDPDAKTPDWMRRRVLARDGNRCRSCGSRFCLMVHHIRWRRRDRGRTCPSNLITLCERCHGLVHALLLFLVGPDAESIRFLDAEGCDVNRSEPPGEAAATPVPESPEAVEAAVGPAPVTLDALPDVVDGAWWRRHEHLIRFGRVGLEFEPGVPAPPEETPDEAPAPAPAFDAAAVRAAFAGLVGLDGLVERFAGFAVGRAVREKAFPHVLLTGPAGTGKTSVAHAIARGHGRRLVKASGPLLEDVSLLLRLLATLRPGDVFFLEEAHAVPPAVLEVLYEAMAERCVTLALHAGNRARSVRLDLPAFTLVAATTEEGNLPRPFVDRFGIHESLGHYPVEALAALVEEQARKEGFLLDGAAARHIAGFARGIPRESLRLLDRALDDAAAAGRPALDRAAASRTLRRLGFDEAGLRPLEQRYLALLRRSPRPMPLSRLTALVGESARTLLRDVEPWLFRLGLVVMTPLGRMAAHPPRLLPVAEAAL